MDVHLEPDTWKINLVEFEKKIAFNFFLKYLKRCEFKKKKTTDEKSSKDLKISSTQNSDECVAVKIAFHPSSSRSFASLLPSFL